MEHVGSRVNSPGKVGELALSPLSANGSPTARAPGIWLKGRLTYGSGTKPAPSKPAMPAGSSGMPLSNRRAASNMRAKICVLSSVAVKRTLWPLATAFVSPTPPRSFRSLGTCRKSGGAYSTTAGEFAPLSGNLCTKLKAEISNRSSSGCGYRKKESKFESKSELVRATQAIVCDRRDHLFFLWR